MGERQRKRPRGGLVGHLFVGSCFLLGDLAMLALQNLSRDSLHILV